MEVAVAPVVLVTLNWMLVLARPLVSDSSSNVLSALCDLNMYLGLFASNLKICLNFVVDRSI